MAARHHDLCFGCGQANLFGLLAELEWDGDGRSVGGRCFIKQDHQGPQRGSAHDGIVAAALIEVMSLACGPDTRPNRLEIEFTGQAYIGEFVELEASRADTGLGASAWARCEGVAIAAAVGSFTSELRPPDP